jgi:hypothetical protein
LLSRLRAVVEAKDAENAALRRELDAERELRRRLAELERRLSMDSTDSGTPSLRVELPVVPQDPGYAVGLSRPPPGGACQS